MSFNSQLCCALGLFTLQDGENICTFPFPWRACWSNPNMPNCYFLLKAESILLLWALMLAQLWDPEQSKLKHTQQPMGGSWAGKQFSPASLRANSGVGNISKTSTWPFSGSQGVLTDHLVPASLPLVENTFSSPPVTNGPLPAFNLSGGPEDDASFNHQEATDDWLQHIMFKLPSLGSLLRKAQELNEEQEYS